MYKVIITIKYLTLMGQKMSDFMSNVGLGIIGIETNPMVIEYTTKTKVDKKYKDVIVKIFYAKFKDEYAIKDIKIKTFKIIK